MRIALLVSLLVMAAPCRAEYGFTTQASSERGKQFFNPREYSTYPAQYYSSPDSAHTYRDHDAGGYYSTGTDYRYGYQPATGAFGAFSGVRWNPQPGWHKTSHVGYYGPGYDRDYRRQHSTPFVPYQHYQAPADDPEPVLGLPRP